MDWTMESVYCGLDDGVSELWTGGGSEWSVDWNRESVDCGMEDGVRGL